MNREFVGVDFSAADLRDARFERTVLDRCNLMGADLRGAKFILCELRSVILVEARFEDSRFDGTTFVDALGLADASRVLIERAGHILRFEARRRENRNHGSGVGEIVISRNL